MIPTLGFYVTRREESSFTNIPTIGAIAGNYDAYRTIAVAYVRDKPESWCFTDTDSAAALGRVVDGPITSAADIDAAELALRALLLHEYVEVVVPCVKADYGSGHVTYVRPDKQLRKDAAFKAFEATPNRDMLAAVEFVQVRNGAITQSSKVDSALIGKAAEDLPNDYRTLMGVAGEVACALPISIGAASAFSAPELLKPVRKGMAGFIDEMYGRVYKPWMEVAQAGVPFGVQLKLPPLLAIVLSRAASRERIPEVIRVLREELCLARVELNSLNQLLDRTLTQAEIHAQVVRANESFDAIVPEALLTDAQRRSRLFASVFNFVKPVRQLYSIATNPLLLNREEIAKVFESAKAVVEKDKKIVSRSVSASKMSDLLRVEYVRQIIQTQFTSQEVELISKPV